ncbi:MAG: hypothetical protein ACK4IC_07300 [Erythrobacter sp.]
MSFQSPIAARSGSLDAAVPPDNLPKLAWWGRLIESSLKIVRNALAMKLGAVDRAEPNAPCALLEALVAECDAIEASTAALVVPPAPVPESFLGHLVRDLEAAVAQAETEARIAALKAHQTRLEELLRIAVFSGPGTAAAAASADR